jgi:acyl-coenzyme A synthetase/AMP-(fatty) acid ligase
MHFARWILKITPDDRLYATSRLFFAYPLANVVFAALGCQASMVLRETWPTQETILQVLRDARPSIFFSVPALYRQLARQEGIAELFAPVRHCVSAGESLNDSLIDAWCPIGKLMNGYGMSETLSFILYSEGGATLKPLPWVQIYSDHQKAAPLRFSHPGLAHGYMTMAGELQNDSIFESQDLFCVAGENVLTYQGRTDHLFKINGRFVNASQEEFLLLSHGQPELKEAAVVCVNNSVGEPQLIWCLVVDEVQRQGLESKLDQLCQNIPSYRRPQKRHYYSALPRTATGKLFHRELIRQLQNN